MASQDLQVPVARLRTSLLRSAAGRSRGDPWLCVPASRRVCPERRDLQAESTGPSARLKNVQRRWTKGPTSLSSFSADLSPCIVGAGSAHSLRCELSDALPPW